MVLDASAAIHLVLLSPYAEALSRPLAQAGVVLTALDPPGREPPGRGEAAELLPWPSARAAAPRLAGAALVRADRHPAELRDRLLGEAAMFSLGSVAQCFVDIFRHISNLERTHRRPSAQAHHTACILVTSSFWGAEQRA